jgi:hypothetical protein
MRHLLTRLAVGLTTFSVGVCAATLFVRGPLPAAVTTPLPIVEVPDAQAQTTPATARRCARLWNNKEITNEQKAVIAAQSFITLEGYTDGSVDNSNIAIECVEGVDNPEENFWSKYDTLEEIAYGISHVGRAGGRGWTVVFRYTERMGNARWKIGRAVTMDENFRNLRVEHKDFFLNKVEKKLQ